jgi:threonine/homoserine/homoserine lactone efflux protein
MNFNVNFATPLAIFVSSFVIALSGAMMPGPLLAFAVRDSARRGVVAAPLLVLGHGILEMALVALIMLGFADWLKGEVATTAIAIAGSAVLLWMAAGMAREIRTLKFAAGDKGSGGERGGKSEAPGAARLVFDGIAASVSNPYWIIWWATIGLGYLVLSAGLGRIGVAYFFAGHILADAAWYFFVGCAVAFGRGRFTDGAYRAVVGVCALCLVFFALSFGYWGMTKLFRLL